MTLPDFLTDTDGWIHVTGHRIGLTDIVPFFNEGYSAEAIAARYPTLPPALVYRIIGFYLEHQDEVDAYVKSHAEEIQRQVATARRGPSMAELRRRLEAMRRTGV